MFYCNLAESKACRATMRFAFSATAALASGNSRLWAFARFNVAFLTARRRARSSFTFALFVRTASSNSDLQYCNVFVVRLMQRSTSFLRESSLSMRYLSSTSSCSRERTGRGWGAQRQYDRQHWQLYRIRVDIKSIPLFPWLFRLSPSPSPSSFPDPTTSSSSLSSPFTELIRKSRGLNCVIELPTNSRRF